MLIETVTKVKRLQTAKDRNPLQASWGSFSIIFKTNIFIRLLVVYVVIVRSCTMSSGRKLAVQCFEWLKLEIIWLYGIGFLLVGI